MRLQELVSELLQHFEEHPEGAYVETAEGDMVLVAPELDSIIEDLEAAINSDTYEEDEEW